MGKLGLKSKLNFRHGSVRRRRRWRWRQLSKICLNNSTGRRLCCQAAALPRSLSLSASRSTLFIHLSFLSHWPLVLLYCLHWGHHWNYFDISPDRQSERKVYREREREVDGEKDGVSDSVNAPAVGSRAIRRRTWTAWRVTWQRNPIPKSKIQSMERLSCCCYSCCYCCCCPHVSISALIVSATLSHNMCVCKGVCVAVCVPAHQSIMKQFIQNAFWVHFVSSGGDFDCFHAVPSCCQPLPRLLLPCCLILSPQNSPYCQP